MVNEFLQIFVLMCTLFTHAPRQRVANSGLRSDKSLRQAAVFYLLDADSGTDSGRVLLSRTARLNKCLHSHVCSGG